MKKEYIEKLIELAEELKELQFDCPVSQRNLIESKTSYLIGYILSLKELNEKNNKVGN